VLPLGSVNPQFPEPTPSTSDSLTFEGVGSQFRHDYSHRRHRRVVGRLRRGSEPVGRPAPDGRVAIAGGAATLNRYLSLGAIDELRLHVVPITLGAGERVFDAVGGLTFDIDGIRPTEHVAHMTLRSARR
jgi:dihydrofolate reductase